MEMCLIVLCIFPSLHFRPWHISFPSSAFLLSPLCLFRLFIYSSIPSMLHSPSLHCFCIFILPFTLFLCSFPFSIFLSFFSLPFYIFLCSFVPSTFHSPNLSRFSYFLHSIFLFFSFLLSFSLILSIQDVFLFIPPTLHSVFVFSLLI